MWRLRRAGDRLCQRAPDERRGIVEKGHDGPLEFALLDRVEVGVKESPNKSARGFGPLAGRRFLGPRHELPDQHGTLACAELIGKVHEAARLA